MILQYSFRAVMCLCILAVLSNADSAALAQEAMSVRPPSRDTVTLPFTVRPVAGGLEVVEFSGPDNLLGIGDVISWVARPDSNDSGAQVTTERGLKKEVQARKDAKNQIALWTTRRNAAQDWVFINVASPSPPNGPPVGPPTATPGYLELPEALGGISLLPGFKATNMPPGRHGEFWGGISGPNGMEIQYSIWPVRPGNGPRTSGDFVSDAARLAEENRQWFREQYIGDALVQIALSNNDQLMVSYPSIGVNMQVAINGPQQLADALLIMLSVPNQNRHVAWAEAEKMIRLGDVKSVTQFHSLTVIIRMGSGMTYKTKEPGIDVVLDVLKRCGKYDKIGIITQ